MKKNGFISTSLIYTFFILFLLLMIFLMNSYSSTRFYIGQYKYDIKNNFAEATMADINLYIMVWNTVTGDYELQDEVPSFGYTYNTDSSYCRYGSSMTYENGSISIAATKRDTCYAYFDRIENDIDLNIYTKETKDSKRVLVSRVPGFEYEFDTYSCTANDAVVVFDDVTRKLKITAKTKTTCDVEFIRRNVDVLINIYKEDVYGNYEYNGLNFQKSNEIPGYGYTFHDAVCKGDTVISPVEGSNELMISASSRDECDVYFVGGTNKTELIFMQETDEGVSGYTTGKKYSRTASPPSVGYKYVGYKCDDPSGVVTRDEDGRFTASSDIQTICRAYFNKYSGNVFIHYYLERSDGTYESVSSVPSVGYAYEKGNCNNGSIITVKNNIVTVDATSEDECYIYYKMLNTDILVNVYVMNKDTQKYELGSVPVTGYSLLSKECTNGASIEYKNSRLIVNAEGPTVCTVRFR